MFDFEELKEGTYGTKGFGIGDLVMILSTRCERRDDITYLYHQYWPMPAWETVSSICTQYFELSSRSAAVTLITTSLSLRNKHVDQLQEGHLNYHEDDHLKSEESSTHEDIGWWVRLANKSLVPNRRLGYQRMNLWVNFSSGQRWCLDCWHDDGTDLNHCFYSHHRWCKTEFFFQVSCMSWRSCQAKRSRRGIMVIGKSFGSSLDFIEKWDITRWNYRSTR